MMPRMWSLSSDYSIPQLKYKTFTPKSEQRLSNYKVDDTPSNKPSDNMFKVKNNKTNKDSASQASFTNIENI
jgi:hypothetical protein